MRIESRSCAQQEERGTLTPWKEAGSRGLVTWFEWPVGYAITDGFGGEPGTSYNSPRWWRATSLLSQTKRQTRVLRLVEGQAHTREGPGGGFRDAAGFALWLWSPSGGLG